MSIELIRTTITKAYNAGAAGSTTAGLPADYNDLIGLGFIVVCLRKTMRTPCHITKFTHAFPLLTAFYLSLPYVLPMQQRTAN